MHKNVIDATILLTTFIAGIAIPNAIFQDAHNVSLKEIKIAKKESTEVLEHPLDFLQIIKLVFREKKQEKIYLDAYTFFGLRYAVVEVVINPQTGQVGAIKRIYPSTEYIIFIDGPMCQ